MTDPAQHEQPQRLSDAESEIAAVRERIAADPDEDTLVALDEWLVEKRHVEREFSALGDRAVRAEARIATLKDVLGESLAIAEAAEWKPARTLAGTIKNFCPLCHGTPSVYRNNPHAARPDGHWLQTVQFPEGCPLARLLDVLRPALAAEPCPGYVPAGHDYTCERCGQAPQDHRRATAGVAEDRDE